MRKLTLTAASAAVLTIAGIGVMSSAQAVQPKAKFNSMRNAVMAKAQQGTTHVQVTASADGTWIVVNGQLVQPDPSGVTHITTPDGGHVTVTTTQDLSKLSPEQRAKVEAMLKNAHSSMGVLKTHSGQSVSLKGNDGRTITAKLKPLSLDLDASHYQGIAFGGNPDTLVLTPKGTEGRRYLVNLNPKSALPVFVSLEQKTSGKWTRVNQSKVSL